MRKTRQRGQVLQAVLLLLIIMSTLVPLLVFYAQREARWTAKQGQSTTAFHLAEAGIEKGYLAISNSTQTWVNLQNGTLITDYKFDKTYNDVSSGTYTISITSGPSSQQATITSVGRDPLSKEIRAITAIYGNSPLGGIAIYGGTGVNCSGNNMSVEWGAIVSASTVTIGSKLHPSYYSAGSIDLDVNGATPPNCDQPNCWWWHSYYAGIPPTPVLDFTFYKSSAQTAGSGPCGSYYASGSKSGSCTDTSGNPYYVEGDWTGFNGCIIGTVIVKGNFTTSNGSLGGCSAINAAMPTQAWKQYANDWSHYQTFDGGAPASFPGLYSSYLSNASLSQNISPVFEGLVYIGGNFTGPTGGGNTDLIYGVIDVVGQVNLNSNSHVTVWYNANAANALQVTQIILSRLSWKDALYSTWPGP